MSIRPVKRLIKSKPTTEGAGVHLRRAFASATLRILTRFCCWTIFRNDVPEIILRGFRGIRTAGSRRLPMSSRERLEHGDSMGTTGRLRLATSNG